MSTVSQVVTGNRPVSAATRARVEAAITRLGYRAHPGAAQLRGGRTGTVALIVPTLENPFYPWSPPACRTCSSPATSC
nr:hypothetical protein GCM10025730_12570 [Promicromonospora thailandica]